MVVAVVLSIIYCSILLSCRFQAPGTVLHTKSLITFGTVAKYFRHSWDVPLSWYTPEYVKARPWHPLSRQTLTPGQQLAAQGILIGPVIFFSKEAIYLLYFDLFHVRKGMRISIIAGMIFTGLVYWTGFIIMSILCTAHIGESWDPLADAPLRRRCPKATYWGIGRGACAVLIDIHIFVLPIPPIVRLQLARKRKIQLLAVFMTALLCVPLFLHFPNFLAKLPC